MTRAWTLGLVLALALSAAACDDDDPATTPTPTPNRDEIHGAAAARQRSTAGDECRRDRHAGR